MIGYLGKRVLALLFTLLLATIAIFAMMHSVPGGPFAFTQGDMTPAAMHNIMVKYGLAEPIWRQYLDWIWQLLHGYLGIPFEEPTMTVNHLIASAWPITLIVGGLTIALSYSLGLVLGCIAAVKHNTWVDSLITAVVSTIGVALPNYVIGFLLIEVFAIKLGWLPVGGWGSVKDVIMPVVAFSLYPMALMERYTRASTLEVTYADYVRMGRARGLSERRILWKYILRTSLIPLITIMGPWIPNILTGSIFIEGVFALPGLGSYFTTASQRRDYPLIMALVLIVAALWGVCFILSDVAYVIVDPRVRIEGASQ
ncbi:MAG TPA: ABC transporter permease, partial [Acidimicrobiales bacterium]|nr:ABC transporter permease [Acidimicrobiales bacterium]